MYAPAAGVSFNPGLCTVADSRHYQSGRPSQYERRVLGEGSLRHWVEQRGDPACAVGLVGTTRFACTIPDAPDAHGDYLSSSETLELAIGEETFAWLTQRYRYFSRVFDAWDHRASCGYGARYVEYNETTGVVRSMTFIIAIRLSSSFISPIAVYHDLSNRTTLALVLRVSHGDQDLIRKTEELHHSLIGHPLFIPTLLFNVSLEANVPYIKKIRRGLAVVEKATGQHGWLEIPAIDAPAHDSELSRLGHAAKIHASIFQRRVDFLESYLELVQQTLSMLEQPKFEGEYEQWLANMRTLFKLRQADVAYYQRRVDNQITAIYGLLSQRDNMLGVSVAIQSKKISEASKRDGSALKSLTVLTALFFPATYIATLFALPYFSRTPFWVYWVVSIPLTLFIFLAWSCWTFYRQHEIARETTRQAINRDMELDPEAVFRLPSSDSESPSFLISTLRQIKSQTKELHHSPFSHTGRVKEDATIMKSPCHN